MDLNGMSSLLMPVHNFHVVTGGDICFIFYTSTLDRFGTVWPVTCWVGVEWFTNAFPVLNPSVTITLWLFVP